MSLLPLSLAYLAYKGTIKFLSWVEGVIWHDVLGAERKPRDEEAYKW